MKIPVFTIVVVCSNTKEIFFRDFLESVVAQTYDNWEMYILDDDNSPILQKITKEFFPEDTRVHYRQLKNHRGKAYGTNIGFHFAEGDYILNVDCHDRLDPQCLYRMADAIFDSNEADVIYSDHIDLEGIEKTNIHVKQDFNKELFLRNDYIGNMVAIKRNRVKEIGLTREVLKEAYIYEYLLRCVEKHCRFYHIPKFLYYKRILFQDTLVDNGMGQEVVPTDRQDSAIVGIIRSIFPSFGQSQKTTPVGVDAERADLVYKEHMASAKAYLTRNNIVADIDSDSRKRFWKVRYSGKGASIRTKDYMLLKDKDIKVSGRNYLETMYGYIKQKDVAVVGVRFAKAFWTTENCGYIYDSEGNVYPAFYNERLRDGGYDNIALIPREIGMVDGGFCMISKKAYRALGGFDSSLTGRDVMLDFCLRARAKGYRVIIDPTIIAKRNNGTIISSEGSHNRLMEKHGEILAKGDPYYSPNFVMGLENHRFQEADTSHGGDSYEKPRSNRQP